MNLNTSTDGVLDIMFNLHDKIIEKGTNIKVEMDNVLKNAENIDGNVQKYEEQLRIMESQQEILEKQHEEDIQIINKLENENRIMTDNLLKKAKSNKNFVENKNEKLQEDYNTSKKREKTEEHKQHNNQNSQELFKSKSGNNIIINPTGPRTLTKKMMREIIDEIYDSKVNYDKYCEENKIQYETLEQHMYTFLNHKYGLKNLVIEWATSIINGIKLFSADDSDICLFGKILRNEIEEESRIVLQRLKITISDLLMVLYYINLLLFLLTYYI